MRFRFPKLQKITQSCAQRGQISSVILIRRAEMITLRYHNQLSHLKMKNQYLLLAFCLFIFSDAVASVKFDFFRYAGADKIYRADSLNAPGEYFNPVISGWASDPSICRNGDDYWLVTSTFGYYPGVALYHSEDLITWEHAGNVLTGDAFGRLLEGVSLDKGGVYAPAISYNPHDGLYYVVTTCVMNGKDGSTLNFYVTATDPLGQWNDIRVLEGVEGIDPSFFFDDDGSAYIVYKSDEKSKYKWSNHRALSVVRFDPEQGHIIGEPQKFRETGVGPEERLERDEGPHIYKIGGKYYLLAAEGGTNWVHSEVCYRADSVMGPYERWSRNPMLTQRLLKPNRKNPVTSAGHADMVQTPDGKWYAVFLGCRPWHNGEDQLGRETFLMPVRWSMDGFPYITQNIDTVALKGRMPGPATGQKAVNAGNFVWTDDFSSDVLMPQWLSLWGSASAYCRLDGSSLELSPAPCDTRSGKTPAYIGRRIQHHDFDVETRLTLPSEKNVRGGILIVKNEQRQMMFAVSKEKVSLRRIGKGEDEIASALLACTGENVELRVIHRDGKYEFLYKTCAADGWQTLVSDVPSDYLATQRGGFTGTTIGVFADRAEK